MSRLIFNLSEIKNLLNKRSENYLETNDIMPFEEINKKIWSIGAEIFVPAAASRLITQSHIDQMISNDLEVISSGANVPFADKEIFFGPISKDADERISVIPDFISNCGMARAFSYCMQDNIIINDISIFQSVSETIKHALQETYELNEHTTNISKTSLEIALKQIL